MGTCACGSDWEPSVSTTPGEGESTAIPAGRREQEPATASSIAQETPSCVPEIMSRQEDVCS